MRRLFLAQYVRSVRTVGAVTPSSRFLARKMVAAADVTQAKVIVEYGPGTGVFTKEIIARKSPSARLIVVEANRSFYDSLVRLYGAIDSVLIVHDSAERIEYILAEHGIKQSVDCIVSGLPFAALPTEVSRRILMATTRVLRPGGAFVTFQYTLLKKNYVHGYFDHLVMTREYRNVPPAYILRCWNDTAPSSIF